MKRKSLSVKVVLSCLILFVCYSGAIVSAETPNERELTQSFVDSFIDANMKDLHVPGAVITIVKDGEVIVNKGFGYANLDKKSPMSSDQTILRVGSIAKLVTVAAALQLYEKGKIDISAEVTDYVKLKIRNPHKAPLKIEHLMTHTGGFDDRLVGTLARDSASQITLSENIIRNLPPIIREPGQVEIYDNAGIELLGYIVEKVSGKPFGDYAKSNIFQPLEMNNSSFRNADVLNSLMETGYFLHKDTLKPYPFYLSKSIDSPNGGLITTGTDMSKMMLAMLSDGSGIFNKETNALMQQHHFPSDTTIPGIAYGFHEGNWNGIRVLGHNGDMEGFRSGMWLIPEKKLGLFINGNSDAGSQLRDNFFEQFMAQTFGSRKAEINNKDQLSQETLSQFTGNYRYDRFSHRTFAKLHLLINSKDMGIQLNAESALVTTNGIGSAFYPYGEVFKDSQGNVLKFIKDGNGNFSKMYFYSLETGSITLNKIPWYESSTIHRYFLLGALLVFILFSIKEMIALIRKKASKKISIMLLTMHVLHLLFLAGIVLVLSNSFELNFGVPLALNILLLIPLLTLAIFIAVIFIAVKIWRNYLQSKLLLVSLITFNLIFYLILNYWNLIGFQ